MHIALIEPEGINKGLNLGLGILVSCLKGYGHKVEVVDLNNNSVNIKNRINKILRYDLIGISIKSFTLESACSISRHIGRKDIICGGPHVTLDGTNLLKEELNFNIGIIGEGEEALVELIDALQKKSSLKDVKGIIYRSNNEAKDRVVTNPRELISNLDSLPFPDYNVFDSVKDIIFDYPILTSRGCPYPCIYCCVGKISGKKMRFRNVEKVLEEIENAKSHYMSKDFHILDDNFTFNIIRAKDFCRLLIKNKINMRWSCPNGIRADCLDEELVSLMKDSGCRQVSIGIESLDEEVFANIKKVELQDDIKNAIALFNKYKIKVAGFFMIGLPKDNLQKNLRSLRKIREIGLETAHWNMLAPYPGTEVWDWIKNNAKIIRDWKEGFHFGPHPKSTFETKEFSEKQMLYIYKLANIRCKNYSAFFHADRAILINLMNIAGLILRYDIWHVFSHLRYVLKNIIGFKRYLHTLR